MGIQPHGPSMLLKFRLFQGSIYLSVCLCVALYICLCLYICVGCVSVSLLLCRCLCRFVCIGLALAAFTCCVDEALSLYFCLLLFVHPSFCLCVDFSALRRLLLQLLQTTTQSPPPRPGDGSPKSNASSIVI